MSLIIPRYIADAHINTTELRYEWDDWDVHKADRPSDPAFVKVTDNFLDRANIALTLAIAEWVMYRFNAVYSDYLPFDYIEGFWAMNVDWRYCKQFKPIDAEWAGPILGPMELAILIANDAFINATENDSTAINPSWMSNLAVYILPDSAAFLAWQKKVIARIEKYYLAEEEDEDDLFLEQDHLGPPVPRELFDPEYEFNPEMTAQLINKFLISLDYTVNPFLRSPEEMHDLGFEGRPYTY